ncbi:MAG: metallopeptidase [Clostridia bacterium]|nr:metallopeptidase [Clostridia bacterium]
MNEEKSIRRSQLARDVLSLSRNQLLVNLRFLDAALSRLEPVEIQELTYATDGRFIAYDPGHILKCYKTERTVPVRDYLHIVLHCIYRHMFVHTLVDHTAWDLACDIAAEYSIAGLGLSCTAAAREARQTAVYNELSGKVGQLTAEKIYRYYLDKKLPPAKMAELRGIFYADDHRVWYMSDEEKSALGLGKGGGRGESDGEGDGDAEGEGEAAAAGGAATDAPLGSEKDWRDVSERIEMDMETFSKQQGDRAGGLMQNLKEVNRERYDYTEFLRRFAVLGEVMKINDDEFDYIFYTYGLSLYKNMPLIEPLEYKDVKRIREFVIAIDTSGSVAGDIVQRFVQKTYNILKSTESFFSKINLHIIQCDAEIQEDVKITTQEEFDRYLKNMTIKGLGGTDFRPVFSYVDELIEKKEFQNLKGLIYFTDGYGTFPEKMPKYSTAFLFLDEEYNNYDVPPWAIKLILRKDEI